MARMKILTTIPQVPVYYFSYGSNLCRNTFENRSKSWGGCDIKYDTAFVATLSGWKLAFNAFLLPPKEPAMASIEQDNNPDSIVYGMVYKLTCAQSWNALLESESAPGKYYDLVRVRVRVSKGAPVETKEIEVVTLVVTQTFKIPDSVRSDIHPSVRYRDLIVQGARREGLPDTYIEKLEAVRAARSASQFESIVGLFSGPLLVTAPAPFVRLYTRIGSALFAARERQNAAWWSRPMFAVWLTFNAIIGFCFIPFNRPIVTKMWNEIRKLLRF